MPTMDSTELQMQAAPFQLYLSIYLPGVALSRMVLESALGAALSVLEEQNVSLAEHQASRGAATLSASVAKAWADAREVAMSICGLEGFQGTFDLQVLEHVATGQIALPGR